VRPDSAPALGQTPPHVPGPRGSCLTVMRFCCRRPEKRARVAAASPRIADDCEEAVELRENRDWLLERDVVLRRCDYLERENRALRQQLGLGLASEEEEEEADTINQPEPEPPTMCSEEALPSTTTTTPTQHERTQHEQPLPRCMVSAAECGALKWDRGSTVHQPPLGPVPEPELGPRAGALFGPFGFVPCDCATVASSGGCVNTGACASMLQTEYACASNPDPGGGGFNDDDDDRLTVPQCITPVIWGWWY
jgi:hypothetical protein